jgi:hypothetical protein
MIEFAKRTIAAIVLLTAMPALAQPPSLPKTFAGRMVAVPGARLFVQIGGSGIPVGGALLTRT